MDHQVQDERPVKKLIITDMDDTLHEAERKVMRDTWNEVLAPWGVVWKPTEHTDPNGRLVTEDERPGVGVRPLEVVKHFIKNYGLDPHAVDEQVLIDLGIPAEDIATIKQQWHTLDDETRIDTWGRIMEKARVKIPERLVAELGVDEIPGAVDMIRRFKQEGYAIGIVTSGSLHYANAVLEKLGLVHRDEEGHPVADYDMLISGEMVKKPKPDREPLDLTQYVLENVDEIEGNGDIRYKPVAMFGDSNSDARFALNAGIPKVFIHKSEYLPEEKMAQLQADLGDRITFVDTWEGMGPEILREDIIHGEGLRSARKEY